MVGSSLFIFALGFFINSISSVYAGNTDKTTLKTEKKLSPGKFLIGCGSGIFLVTQDGDGYYDYDYSFKKLK